jgi:hypothetical protein
LLRFCSFSRTASTLQRVTAPTLLPGPELPCLRALTAVAVCPHPPLLVPQIAGGAAGELDDLRAACDEAVARMLSSGPARVLVVGTDDGGRGLARYAPGSADLPGGAQPLALAIGDWLLDRAGADQPRQLVGVRPDGTAAAGWGDVAATPTPTGLLVMGDGSARRTKRAPGYLDERAEGFDAGVTKALATADVDALAALDVDLAAELWVGGIGAFKALAALAAGNAWQADVSYDAAPYGVGYTVACWMRA